MANWTFFGNHRLRQHNGNAVVFTTGGDTIKMALMKPAWSPAPNTETFLSDINANECTGGGYTAGGTALSGKTLTLSSGSLTFDSNDVTFSQSGTGFTDARYAVLYKDTGVAGTSALIAYGDLTSSRGNVAGDLVIQMDAAGIFTSP